jgi:peptide/nickel transport system substrate-binding protein
MKRRLVLTLSVAVAAVVAAGSVARSDAAVSRKSATIPLLVIGVAPTYANLDPAKTFGNGPVGLYTLETLLKLGGDGTVKPNLAVSWNHPNPFVYIYNLRKGVKFWNGNEMTSQDVAASINYQRHPTSTTSTRFQSVRDVKPLDKYRVQVTLKYPDQMWLRQLAWTGTIFEEKFFLEHKGTMGNPGVLIQGTGPWKVDSWDPTRGMELSANPNYWGGKVNIDHITTRIIANETAMALAFRAGQIDVAFPGNGSAFAATANTKVVGFPAPNMSNITMNVTVPPWNDVHVRRAVAYAINRTDYIKASGGYITPGETFVSRKQLLTLGSAAEVDKLLKSLPSYPYSVAKAKEELAKSAYPNGINATTDVAGSSDAALYVVGALKEVGINLKLNVVPIGVLLASLQTKTLGFLLGGAGQINPDPHINVSRLLGKINIPAGGLNTARYAPPDLEPVILECRTAANRAKRLACYGKLLNRLLVDAPYVVIGYPQNKIALSSKFKIDRIDTGLYPTQQWPLQIKLR